MRNEGARMSINKENRLKLQQAVAALGNTIRLLSDVPADFAALDLIEVAMGLLERQVEMNIEYVTDEPNDSDFLFIGNENELASTKPFEETAAFNETEDTPYSNQSSSFSFLDESDDDDIPTPDELEYWFNLPSE